MCWILHFVCDMVIFNGVGIRVRCSCVCRIMSVYECERVGFCSVLVFVVRV